MISKQKKLKIDMMSRVSIEFHKRYKTTDDHLHPYK